MMKLFPSKKTAHGNVRKKKSAPVKKQVKIAWIQSLMQVVVAVVIIAGLGYGVLQLNDKLAVAYWDIEANQSIKVKIEKYFAEQQHKDFWHSRASVIQHDLLARIPDIKQLEVSRILPDGLLIKAIARKPLALWESMDKASPVMLVDDSGKAYRALEAGENLDLPLLRLNKSELQTAMMVLNQLHHRSAQKLMNLSELIVKEKQWRLNFTRGEQWQLDQARLEQDVEQVINILETPRWSRGTWRMDARSPQRWFIRPAKQEVI